MNEIVHEVTLGLAEVRNDDICPVCGRRMMKATREVYPMYTNYVAGPWTYECSGGHEWMEKRVLSVSVIR